MIYAAIYVAGILLFLAWDSIIGFGYEFDESWRDSPPAWVGAIFWPLVFPISLLYSINRLFRRIKNWRINREFQKEKIRIARIEEEQKILKLLEEEMTNENQSLHNSKSV